MVYKVFREVVAAGSGPRAISPHPNRGRSRGRRAAAGPPHNGGFFKSQLNFNARPWQGPTHSLPAQPRPPPFASRSVPTFAARTVASTSGSTELRPGVLVDYTKDGKHVLGLVLQQDGKKNWWVLEQGGRRYSLQPKQVSLVLQPGASSYGEADIGRFLDASVAADASMLEVAWAIALDGGGSSTLEDLTRVLYDDATPAQLFCTYRMLLADGLYFRTAKGGASYEARPEREVTALRAAVEEERRRVEEREGWRLRAGERQQRPAGREEWLAGPYGKRVAALEEWALNPGNCSLAAQRLASESMALLGAANADADSAWDLLVELGCYSLHASVQLYRMGLHRDFSDGLQAAAQALLDAPPPDPDIAIRADLRRLSVYTIDSETTKEVDDGVSLEVTPDGQRHVWVHIADPTRWLTPGGALDLEARRRQRSLYFPFGSISMFPKLLASGPFSLRPDEDCCALSVRATLGDDGSLVGVRVVPSTVRITHKMSYSQADDALAHFQDDTLLQLHQVALLRKQWRTSNGCIEIDLPEANIEVPPEDLDKARPAVTISRSSQWESPSRGLVAELMILAGEVVGTMGQAAGLPLPYRGQEVGELPPASELAALPPGPCTGYALRRCMRRSSMTPTPAPHSSLALQTYVQSTSPIRRYTDLMAHFNLKAHLRGEPPPFSAEQIAAIIAAGSERGRELGRVESDVEKYWAAEYFAQHAGATANAGNATAGGGLWRGSVLGYFRREAQLVSVLLEDLGLEAVVRSSLPLQPGQRLTLACSEAQPARGFYRLYVVDVENIADDDDEEEHEEASDDAAVAVGTAAAGDEAAAAAAAADQGALPQLARDEHVDEVAGHVGSLSGSAGTDADAPDAASRIPVLA